MAEFRPTRFEMLPLVIKNLLIINGLVFLAQKTIGNSLHLNDWFALHTFQSELFKPWQFVTYMFMHADIWHLLFNMFALWMFGSVLENLWGPKKFLTFYLICGLGAALCHMLVLYYEFKPLVDYFHSFSLAEQEANRVAYESNLSAATLGASGAVYGCLAAFGYLFPNQYLYFGALVPVKAKWAVTFYIVVELFQSIQASAGDTVAHIAHLGGALFGFLLVYYWNKTNKRTFY